MTFLEQQIIALLSQLTTHDNVVKLTELIGNSVNQRTQLINDEKEQLISENKRLSQELELKKRVIAELMIRQQHLSLSIPQSTVNSVMDTEEDRIDIDS